MKIRTAFLLISSLFVLEHSALAQTTNNFLTDNEKSEGYILLFNGRNMDGWTGNKTDYIVEKDHIVIYPDRGGEGNIYTEREFSDFIFRFEFNLTPGANNGLGIRTAINAHAAYEAMEIQILDNTAEKWANLEPYQYHGSIYGVVAAEKGYLKPAGEWNHQEVLVQGSRVRVILNGHTILDTDYSTYIENETPDHQEHPGLLRKKGHIGFLGHGDIVRFRNIKIREL